MAAKKFRLDYSHKQYSRLLLRFQNESISSHNCAFGHADRFRLVIVIELPVLHTLTSFDESNHIIDGFRAENAS